MNKLLTISILATAALGACTTERVVEVEKTTATIDYVTPTTSPANPEIDFVNGLSEDYPAQVSSLGKVKTVELGRLMCEAIDDGTTIQDVARMGVELDVDAGFLGAIIRESVRNFCPENQWFIDSALNA